MGAERGRLSRDDARGLRVGTGLCRGQFDAAGAAGRGCAALASASVSLNTSVLYVGQAIGSFVGGLFYERELLHGLGFVAAAFVALGLVLVVMSKPGRTA